MDEALIEQMAMASYEAGRQYLRRRKVPVAKAWELTSDEFRETHRVAARAMLKVLEERSN